LAPPPTQTKKSNEKEAGENDTNDSIPPESSAPPPVGGVGGSLHRGAVRAAHVRRLVTLLSDHHVKFNNLKKKKTNILNLSYHSEEVSSVVDPELFIADPDPTSESSGSGCKSGSGPFLAKFYK